MYLKSLELQGFKSFPDRTTIRFSDGITAIVGPNGSGKSNISDAVRWVLGEQSTKSLRGDKMEDVIFGGTAKRGRMGFAQVTLILDNSEGRFPMDAAEVMVSRRYYRSGESEYFLNKKRVRLKDVRELFMDTGLGRDGYSIIGQGRIDEILSTKSVDRREVFEEAAGITKFRTRKGEAEKRLEQTDNNLARIRDVWNELDARSGPLQQQAETAKQYLVLHDELRVHEVSLWMDSLDGMKDAIEAGEQALRTAQTDLQKAKDEQSDRYHTIEQLEFAIQSADMQTEQLRTQRAQTEGEQAARAQRAAVLEESRRNAAQNILLAKEQISAQSEQKQTIAAQKETRQTRLKELEQEIRHIQTEQTETAQQLAETAKRGGEGQKEMEELRRTAEQYAEHIFRLQNEQTAVKTQLETMEARQGSIADEIQAAQTRAEQERATQAGMQETQRRLEEDIARQEDDLAEQRSVAEQTKAQLQEARRVHGRLQSTLLDSRNRIRMLLELQKDYEGFSRAVKLIMNRSESGQLDGIHGPVSSLIRVEDRYVTAIETALGAAASNIIVDTPEDAKHAIGLLKRSDGGRATFLPVDTIRPMTLNERGLEQQDGFCGIAAELVSCDGTYRDIVFNLLGRTVVMENLDCALEMARRHRNRFRIVTCDGQVVHAGGSLTGGSTGRSSGILSRANQLKALQEKERVQAGQLEELEERGHALAAQAQEAEEMVEAASELLGANRQKLAAQQAAARQHQLLLDSVEQSFAQLRAERDDADRLRKEYEQNIGRLEHDIQAVAQERGQAEERALQAEQSGQQTADRLRELGEQAALLRTKLVQAQTEQDAHRQALHDLQALLVGAEQTAQDAERRITEYETQSEADAAELEQLAAQSERTETVLAELKQSIQDSTEQRTRLEANKTEQNKLVQALSSQIVSLEREVARAEANTARIRGEEKQLLDKLWEGYELTPTAARTTAQPVEDRAAMEKRANSLRSEIRKLGPVNIGAIEEYDKLAERLVFLTEQKDDLEKAEGELRGIIAELTVQMQQVFAESFALLNQYFGETFREMFGGGSAELRLEDENDVLGCGIEIRVTPPGKSVKNLSLLSGGEKAFVAIALYFAIMKVRPTPFCILDEIEAALDDVNVTRYARYLRRLSDKTQFIVITHRRGTMEEADMLYGVTMQERGVSKLLMLNIREVEEQLGIEM
ncbi:MAG: chromosome segregation protein SMC [Eubacteriales bacterium]|nr:chromosome segregation protein SMC [Eubacteriales bacterium]